jgi:hypothetical protein
MVNLTAFFQAGRRRFDPGLPLQKQRTYWFARIRRYDNYSLLPQGTAEGFLPRQIQTSLLGCGKPQLRALPKKITVEGAFPIFASPFLCLQSLSACIHLRSHRRCGP